MPKRPLQLVRSINFVGHMITFFILALRKAPQISAIGFRQAATKLLTVVDLLMGDIPERARFIQKNLEKSLIPYFHLTQAVRTGNLTEFNKGKADVRDTIFHTTLFST